MWKITATSFCDALDDIEDFLSKYNFDGEVMSLTATLNRGVRFVIDETPTSTQFVFDIFDIPLTVRSHKGVISFECAFNKLDGFKSAAEVIKVQSVKLQDENRCERLKPLVDNLDDIKAVIASHGMSRISSPWGHACAWGGCFTYECAANMLVQLLDAYCAPQ